MRVISRAALREFWVAHGDAEGPLLAWCADAEKAAWASAHDIKLKYANASILGDQRICFNIKGNDYRLVVRIHFNTGTVYVRFVGTHAEYDRIDAETI
jgi:mRNA interferase HigB